MGKIIDRVYTIAPVPLYSSGTLSPVQHIYVGADYHFAMLGKWYASRHLTESAL